MKHEDDTVSRRRLIALGTVASASLAAVAPRAAAGDELLPVDDRYVLRSRSAVNAKDHGATGDGTTNDAAAIQTAIQAVPATGGSVFFPPGTYRVDAAPTIPPGVQIEGKGVTFTGAGAGALGSAILNLSGLAATKADRANAAAGPVFSRDTYGTRQSAVVAGFVANRSANPTVEVLGTSDPSAVAERPTVAVFIDGTAKAATVDTTSTSFAAGSVTFGSGVDLSRVRPGMIVDVGGNAHVGGETAVGVVASVAAQTVTLTAARWRVGGGPTATPQAGARVRINRVNKVWGLNVNARSTSAEGSPLTGTSLVGIEVGIETDHDYAADGLREPTGRHAFGVDTWRNVHYAGRPLSHFAARGAARYGFAASGVDHAQGAYFVAHDVWEPGGAVGAGFLDEGSRATTSFRVNRSASTHAVLEAYGAATDAQPRLRVRPNRIEMGDGAASAPDLVLERDAPARAKLTGSLKATGHGRFEGTGTLAGASAAEIGYDGMYAYVVGYDRDAAQYRGTRVNGDSVVLQARATNRLEVNATGIGFFGAPPVSRPARVPETAAGVHAALVSLGLITA